MRRSRREEEFTENFSVRAPALRRTAYLIVRDWHVAEDLTQTAFVRLNAAWPRIDVATRDAYARKIVVNQCLTHVKRRPPETVTDTLPEHEHPEQGGRLDIGQALGLLPPRQRAIIALRFVDDLSVADTGRALGIAAREPLPDRSAIEREALDLRYNTVIHDDAFRAAHGYGLVDGALDEHFEADRAWMKDIPDRGLACTEPQVDGELAEITGLWSENMLTVQSRVIRDPRVRT